MIDEKKFRTIILEDAEDISELLREILERRGHEVFIYNTPAICPLQPEPACRCGENEQCTDIIITDIWMPHISGIDYLRNLKEKGCKCSHIAVISAGWKREFLNEAISMGCKIFDKPFSVNDIERWLDDVEQSIQSNRTLSNWFQEC